MRYEEAPAQRPDGRRIEPAAHVRAPVAQARLANSRDRSRDLRAVGQPRCAGLDQQSYGQPRPPALAWFAVAALSGADARVLAAYRYDRTRIAVRKPVLQPGRLQTARRRLPAGGRR